MGDPARTLQAAEQIKIIERDELVNHTALVGSALYDSLESLSKGVGKGKLLNLRGKDCGTFLAWDAKDAAQRDEFIKKMRYKGINLGGSGERAVRLRPMREWRPRLLLPCDCFADFVRCSHLPTAPRRYIHQGRRRGVRRDVINALRFKLSARLP